MVTEEVLLMVLVVIKKVLEGILGVLMVIEKVLHVV